MKQKRIDTQHYVWQQKQTRTITLGNAIAKCERRQHQKKPVEMKQNEANIEYDKRKEAAGKTEKSPSLVYSTF